MWLYRVQQPCCLLSILTQRGSVICLLFVAYVQKRSAVETNARVRDCCTRDWPELHCTARYVQSGPRAGRANQAVWRQSEGRCAFFISFPAQVSSTPIFIFSMFAQMLCICSRHPRSYRTRSSATVLEDDYGNRRSHHISAEGARRRSASLHAASARTGGMRFAPVFMTNEIVVGRDKAASQ